MQLLELLVIENDFKGQKGQRGNYSVRGKTLVSGQEQDGMSRKQRLTPTFMPGIVLANLKVNGIPSIVKIIKAPGNILSISRETRHVGCILGPRPKN